MSDATITINLGGGQQVNVAQLGNTEQVPPELVALRRYAPGEVLTGTAYISANKQLDCRNLTAQLGWHTEGRGDRDEAIAAKIDLYRGVLNPGFPTSYEFSFVVPAAPWSYGGHYITIVWAVTIEIDLAWRSNPRVLQSFVLLPAWM
jgi:hypothetical protein